MTLIIDRCPFYDTETAVETPSGPMPVRAYQIIVWVSLSLGSRLSRPFPAVLDTGHSHNFSMKEDQLENWTGWKSGAMDRIGTVRLNDRVVVLRAVDLALHPNVPEKRDELRGEPRLLEMSQGMVIARPQDPFATRLPALGLRVLARNGLRVVIDGRAKTISLGVD
jgi:hypothetical protein